MGSAPLLVLSSNTGFKIGHYSDSGCTTLESATGIAGMISIPEAHCIPGTGTNNYFKYTCTSDSTVNLTEYSNSDCTLKKVGGKDGAEYQFASVGACKQVGAEYQKAEIKCGAEVVCATDASATTWTKKWNCALKEKALRFRRMSSNGTNATGTNATGTNATTTPASTSAKASDSRATAFLSSTAIFAMLVYHLQ